MANKRKTTSSIKVSKITVSEHTFEQQFKKPDDDAKKCMDLMPAKELLALLPKTKKTTLRFYMDGANSQLTNAIRRCLEDELPVKSLTFNLMHDSDGKQSDFITDLRTNDKNIFGKCDELKKRIEAIPIRQNIVPSEWKITLDVHNKTQDLINITASNFKILHKGKSVPVESLMFPDYILTRLYPNRYLQLTNIYINVGISMDNANSFKLLSNIYYSIDEPPMTKVGEKYIGKSSMESDYTKFEMGYTTYRNDVQIYDPIKSACANLIERLQVIDTEWKKIDAASNEKKSDVSSAVSDKIQVKVVAGAHVITIEGEYYTIANLLHYYVFKELPTIEFGSGGIRHLDKMGAIITIKNKNYLTLFSNAIQAAINDLHAIQMAFK